MIGEPILDALRDSSASAAVSNPLFIGRDNELGVLYSGYRSILGGRGTLVAIESEAGLGKTTLVATFLGAIGVIGAEYIEVRGYQPQRESGFTILKTLLTATRLRPALQHLSSTQSLYLQRVLENPAEFAALNADRRNFVFDATARVLEASARGQPLVLFLDDLHWMDESSLHAIGFLARRLDTFPLMLIASFRPEFNIGRYLGSGNVTVCHLQRFSLQDIATHLRKMERTGHTSCIAAIGTCFLNAADNRP
jgi:hypothetical protein